MEVKLLQPRPQLQFHLHPSTTPTELSRSLHSLSKLTPLATAAPPAVAYFLVHAIHWVLSWDTCVLRRRVCCLVQTSKKGGRWRVVESLKLVEFKGRFFRALEKWIVGVMLVVSFSLAVTNYFPSWALSEENLLFMEAWRTIGREYVDESFNGQSWFRYRENALRTEPMNTRGRDLYVLFAQVCDSSINVCHGRCFMFMRFANSDAAIRKMVATLDDPFTRFLDHERFR